MYAEWLGIVVVVLYMLVMLALSAYGLNFLYVSFVAPRVRRQHVECPLPAELPFVTVQLPIFNERFVAERVIESAACLDWPADRIEIQVLDDSTDDTRDMVARAVVHWQAEGVDIRHIHREDRRGFKAGALSAGLALARGEYIALLDADFVPEPDFLKRTMGGFADPKVAYVQARWDHLNRDTSLLTRLQSLGIDTHFMIEQLVRSGKGLVMSFNGTAGIWRRAAIEDAGGWSPSTLTEDLDLSYRAALRGWKTVYLPDVAVPAELVPSIAALRKQQTRWAQGSAENARRLIPSVLRSDLPLGTKIHSVLHLTAYFVQALMLSASLLYPLMLLAPAPGPWKVVLSVVGMALLPTAAAPVYFCLTGQRLLRPRTWWREIPYVLSLWLLGAGLMVSNTRALWRGLRGRPTEFERTPKWGLVGGRAKIKRTRYSLTGDGLVIVELIVAGINVATAILAWMNQNIGLGLSAALLATGLTVVSSMTIWESWSARHAR